MTACFVPLRKVCIDLFVEWEEEEAQTSKMVKQAKQLLNLTSNFSLFWVAERCFSACLWVYLSSAHLSIVPHCLLVLQCSPSGLRICMSSYTNHKHTHSLSASSCCFHRLCLLPSDVDSDQICSNAFSYNCVAYQGAA